MWVRFLVGELNVIAARKTKVICSETLHKGANLARKNLRIKSSHLYNENSRGKLYSYYSELNAAPRVDLT